MPFGRAADDKSAWASSSDPRSTIASQRKRTPVFRPLTRTPSGRKPHGVRYSPERDRPLTCAVSGLRHVDRPARTEAAGFLFRDPGSTRDSKLNRAVGRYKNRGAPAGTLRRCREARQRPSRVADGRVAHAPRHDSGLAAWTIGRRLARSDKCHGWRAWRRAGSMVIHFRPELRYSRSFPAGRSGWRTQNRMDCVAQRSSRVAGRRGSGVPGTRARTGPPHAPPGRRYPELAR